MNNNTNPVTRDKPQSIEYSINEQDMDPLAMAQMQNIKPSL